MKNLWVGYLLAALGLLSPVAGLHRFYLGMPVSGFFYLITWGFFGLGTIIDLVRLDSMVEDVNLREHLRLHASSELRTRLLGGGGEPESPEQKLLRAAKKHEGALTVATASLETGIALKRCRKLLDQLDRDGFCQLDVTEEGEPLYVFSGLKTQEPFTLE